MKRCNLISLLVLFSGLFIVMFMISCGKEGAPGPAGANGANGAPGPAGPKGDSNSGSVIYSAWLDVPYKPDTVHLSGGRIDTIGYYANIDAPKLTLELLSTAEVKVYLNTNDVSDPTVYPLPYYGTSGLNIEVSSYKQTIQLYSNADVSTITISGKKYQQYRYMIVPGNVQARSATPVNWLDYTAVKLYLGLKD
jgi:hypothetical protein